MNLIVFADEHAQYYDVLKMHDFLRHNGYLVNRTIASVGDNIDNGPYSRELLDFSIERKKEGDIYICGNHEYVLRQVANQRTRKNTKDGS